MIIKKFLWSVLGTLLLCAAACALGYLFMLGFAMTFVFIKFPIEDRYVLQIVFAATVLISLIVGIPKIWDWVAKLKKSGKH